MHPTLERFRTILHELGSTANTPHGLVNFYRRSISDYGRCKVRVYLLPCSKLSATEWVLQRDKRRADPDAKRARDDHGAYRKRYLARLRKRELRAIEYDSSTLDGILSRVDSDDKRRAELTEVACLRSIVLGKDCEPLTLKPCTDGALVSIDAATARQVGAPINMRGKDARVIPTRRQSYGYHSEGWTTWKGGVPRSYTRATHNNYVRSVAFIVTPQTIDYICHTTRVSVSLPEGYSWHIDDNGLRAYRIDSPQDDYHPSAMILVGRKPALYITTTIEANRQRRQLMKAKEAAERAQLLGVYVCVADSLRAGNCPVGTRAFAERHSLDPRRHYEALELLTLANGDASRVRLAITAARLRHERELEAGVCVLADHTS